MVSSVDTAVCYVTHIVVDLSFRCYHQYAYIKSVAVVKVNQFVNLWMVN